MMDLEQKQAQHYDAISEEYNAHYGDPQSIRYRHRFVFGPLLRGLELNGATFLDAMCGQGEVSEFVRARGAKPMGLDVSPEQVKSYERHCQGSTGICASILDTGLDSESVDYVSVIGGLHHVQPDVPGALREIHRILKPGGMLLFFEPHKGSFFDLLRRVWYGQDGLFEDNEEALDMKALRAEFADSYHVDFEYYKGNIAYLFVYNSMVFRLPVGAKKYYAPPLLFLERLIAPFQFSWNSCFVIGRWQKRPTP